MPPISSAETGVSASLQEMLSIYGPVQLISVVENLKTSSVFLLDHCFPNEVLSQAPEVAIDVDIGKRRLAPFCSPLVEGKPVESRRWQTNLFTPPYVKDLRNPDILKPVRRQIGERIGGDLTIADRLEQNLIYEMADQIDMINRRCEWMAAQALTKGKIKVEGDGYPSTLIDFQRDPALTIALSGAAQWGQDGVSPADDIMNWAQLVLQKSGAYPTEVYFSTTAWNKFRSDPKILNQIFQRAIMTAGSREELDRQIDLGGRMVKGGAYMGSWGQFDLYLYNDWYVDVQRDDKGNVIKDSNGQPVEIEEPMLPDGSVILSGPAMQGTRMFGLILDPWFNYQPLAYAPKLWISKNPANINLLIQSSPLMIPSRVNAALCATVCTPGTGSGGSSTSGS